MTPAMGAPLEGDDRPLVIVTGEELARNLAAIVLDHFAEGFDIRYTKEDLTDLSQDLASFAVNWTMERFAVKVKEGAR